MRALEQVNEITVGELDYFGAKKLILRFEFGDSAGHCVVVHVKCVKFNCRPESMAVSMKVSHLTRMKAANIPAKREINQFLSLFALDKGFAVRFLRRCLVKIVVFSL